MTKIFAKFILLLSLILSFNSCGIQGDADSDSDATGLVEIEYWEKWNNQEKEAMLAIIKRFHSSQDRIRVNYSNVRDNRMKTLLATAGGNPPDIAGLFPEVIPKYAEKEALIPLDRMMERDGLSRDDYIPAISEMLEFEGRTWCLPTTPASLALFYNKKRFREAILDPEKPPETLKELDEYAKILTQKSQDNRIVKLGFSPEIPTWFRHRYIYWFGGQLWDEDRGITIDTPEFIAMLEWIQGYPIQYGITPLERFHSSEGQVQSAQNHFISGRVAMQLQGVWMPNLFKEYNRNLEWAVAPFPSAVKSEHPTTFVDSDVLVIPAGANHPEEAWEFIKFVQQQKNMELLCRMQGKYSPLREVSDNFYERNLNPAVKLFRELAESPNARSAPRVAIIDDLVAEVNHAVRSVWLREATPEEAAGLAQEKLEVLLDQHTRQWKRVKEHRMKNWDRL